MGSANRLRDLIRPLWLPSLILLAVLAALLLLNGGRLAYTLDDAYIHLSLAEGIAHGHYGLSPGEVSAASSSIAWPFLMALGRGALWLPVALNLVLALASLLLALAWLRELWPQAGPRTRDLQAVLVLVAGNLAGLPFTGLEHVAQVALSLLLLRGLWAWLEDGRLGVGWQAVLMLAPLLR